MIFRVVEVLTTVLVATLVVVLVVFILLTFLEGFVTEGGIGRDVALNLAAEGIAFTLSILLVNEITGRIKRRKEKLRRLPLMCTIYARLIGIVRDLTVNILPQEAYEENDSVYESNYGDSAAPGIDLKQESLDRLFALTNEYVERRYTDGGKVDVASLDHVKEQLENILDRSFSLLDPEFVSYLLRLETRLEHSVELLGGMKDEDWQEEPFRQKVAYSLSLVAFAAVKVREWLDRMLDEHFNVVT
jgi:hypothetical protein